MIGLATGAALFLAALLASPRVVVIWVLAISSLCLPMMNIRLGPLTVEPLFLAAAVFGMRATGVLPSPRGRIATLARLRAATDAPRSRGASDVRTFYVLVVVLLVYVLIDLLVSSAAIGALSNVFRLVAGVMLAGFVTARALVTGLVTGQDLRNSWTTLTLVAVALASVEWLSGSFIFGPETGLFHEAARNGGLRSQAFFPHPIIFGLFCAVGLLWWLYTATSVRTCWYIVLPLAWGLWISGSRGPILALVLAVLVVFLSTRFTSRTGRRFVLLLAMLGAFFAIMVSLDGTDYVGGIDETETSTQYRFALLNVGSAELLANPFGHGPGRLPQGLLMVDSRFGVIDLSPSVDNAYLLFGLQYGLPALILAALICLKVLSRGIREVGRDESRAPLAMWVFLLVSGSTVSLLSWPPVALLLGQVAAMVLTLGRLPREEPEVVTPSPQAEGEPTGRHRIGRRG